MPCEMPAATTPVANLARIVFEDIYDDDLFERTEVPSAISRRKYQAFWRQLRGENAALRILKGNELASAPISFFDPALMSQASENWRKVARIVSMTLHSEAQGHASDLFLAARVNALVASGNLERQGRSAVDMRRCEMRLSQAQQTSFAGQ